MSTRSIRRGRTVFTVALIAMSVLLACTPADTDTPSLVQGVETPADLDALWAKHFKTRDPAAISKIASVLPLIDEGRGEQLLLGEAARWSLVSNAKQHPGVLEIVQRLSQDPGPAQNALKGLLEELRTGKRPARLPLLHARAPGDLGAIVFVSGSLAFAREWFTTAFEHRTRLRPLKRVTVDQVFHIAVFVSGYLRDSSGQVDVVAEITVRDPTGKVFLGESMKIGHKGPMGEKPGILLIPDALDVMIEPSDPMGDYNIDATVVDKVSGTTTSATTTVTVVEGS